jgi:hypothetical protein
MDIRTTDAYKKMDSYTACSYAEGFSETEPTEVELHAAWQWLVDTGLCWQLQGWYGRAAASLIEASRIEPKE